MSSTSFSATPQSYPPFFQLNEPHSTSSWIVLTLLAILLSYGAFLVLKPDPMAHIPAIGGSDILSVYFSRKRFNEHSHDLIRAGYYKYQKRPFRIPDNDGRWHVVVARQDQIEDLRKAPVDVLSFRDFTNELLFTDYLLGKATNEYHFGILRSHLTKNLAPLFDDLYGEIQDAFADNIPLTEDWTSVHAYPKVVQIVARASNRIFVGLPLCRDPEFLKINIDLVIHVNEGRKILMRFPRILRPSAAKYITTAPQAMAKAAEFLGPIIKERREKMEEYGRDYPNKPSDLLEWLMEGAPDPGELGILNLTSRIVGFNFAAIHTSGMSFTHALYHLAAEPHYIQPIREEIEAVIAEDGWTKVAMARMHKLDSFFKESQRYNGIAFLSLSRLSLKNFTFSDGTVIPKGTFVSAAAYPIHHDDEKYPDGDKFDGFRFADIRTHDDLNTTNQYVNTSKDYLVFGHGKHACPGRFFAADELKAMMVHLLLNYDIKLETEGVRPPNISLATTCMPNMTARVMFRRRPTGKSGIFVLDETIST